MKRSPNGGSQDIPTIRTHPNPLECDRWKTEGNKELQATQHLIQEALDFDSSLSSINSCLSPLLDGVSTTITNTTNNSDRKLYR